MQKLIAIAIAAAIATPAVAGILPASPAAPTAPTADAVKDLREINRDATRAPRLVLAQTTTPSGPTTVAPAPAPTLIGLLLPAVQKVREAAR